MARNVLIFGNGLGMALNAEKFLLENAVNAIWGNNQIITQEEKSVILSCSFTGTAPRGENELDVLHRAVAACTTLNELANDSISFLTNAGETLPSVAAKLIFHVSSYFHNSIELEDDFLTPLKNYIRKTNSHVATLNYDRLLYKPFCNSDILDGYDGYLVDGMLNKGFEADNLKRHADRNFGYYLHLHGSPLFYEENNLVYKTPLSMLGDFNGPYSNHIVLTHVKHKPSVIASSRLLRTYWDYLQFALHESTRIVLFGYSGLDEHLNKIIKMYSSGKGILVVEWSNNHDHLARKSKWNSLFGTNRVQLELLDNILDFRNWQQY